MQRVFLFWTRLSSRWGLERIPAPRTRGFDLQSPPSRGRSFGGNRLTHLTARFGRALRKIEPPPLSRRPAPARLRQSGRTYISPAISHADLGQKPSGGSIRPQGRGSSRVRGGSTGERPWRCPTTACASS